MGDQLVNARRQILGETISFDVNLLLVNGMLFGVEVCNCKGPSGEKE